MRLNFVSDVKQATTGIRRRPIWLLAAILVVVGLAFIAGIGWVFWQVYDNIDAPGPAATGSGPCGSSDSVNIQLIFSNGRTVQACTADRPDCPNSTISGTANGQSQNVSQFALDNQLRSSSRRYILLIRFDAALPADSSEQTLSLQGGPAFMPGEQGSATLSTALVTVIPRDPKEEAYTTVSGSLTVSSAGGVARGRIDGQFTTGVTRSDRPAPSSNVVTPVSIAGTFACKH